MLVALGPALFIIVPLEAHIPLEHLSRAVQGIVIGIGFLGGGAILKLSRLQTVKGLTTAAGVWLTAGVGMAVGFGLLWPSIVAVILALIILNVAVWIEAWIRKD